MPFVPQEVLQEGTIPVPFFEDATTEKDGVRGHGTTKSIEQLKAELRTAVARLGGGVLHITPGTFTGAPKRHGYRVEFIFGPARGRIDIAALPMRSEAPMRKKQALKQALFMVIAAFEAQYFMLLLSPGANPLIPYLIGPGGKTLGTMLSEQDDLPQLTGGDAEIVVGEVID